MEQHEFIASIWNNRSLIDSMNDHELSKYFFLFNRTCARKFPVQANQLNKNGISTGYVVKYWITTLRRLYKDIPDFILENVYRKKKSTYTDSEMQEFCKLYRCTEDQFLELYDFFPDKILEELKNFDDSNGIKKQKKKKILNAKKKFT